MRRQALCVLMLLCVLSASVVCSAASKVKIRGYVTAKPDAQTLQILDDIIHFGPSTGFSVDNPVAGVSLALNDLPVGTMVEAEGTWTARHQFAAEKISCDASQSEREIHSAAFLDREPPEASAISSGQGAKLSVDGEFLLVDNKTQRAWPAETQEAAAATAGSTARSFVGRQVRYEGVRRQDGSILARKIELASPAPADAYKIPGDRAVVRAQDKQTGIDILEFRKGKKVEGRLKLFPVKEVQEYVSELGRKLLPPSSDVTARSLEFRFFVVEDPSVNAASLPDGTILINTGLMGAVQNEAQLAFVMSHEIAHVLQAHYWREVNETRSKRVLITIAAIAGSGFIGDVSLFLGQLGLAAVVNGYSRQIENQADRLALQNLISLGYDPRATVGFFKIMIERYSDRSTSALWSNHDSSLLRGSFLSVQLNRQYPQGQFDKSVADTDKFKTMKEVMGPVKVI